MSKKRPPAPPDPYETAQADASLNRIDTYSPSGAGVVHGYTDASGNFVQGPAPEGMQAAQRYVEGSHEKQIRNLWEPASVELSQRLVRDNVTNMPDAARVKDRSDVARDLFDRSFSMMNPAIEKSERRLLTSLQGRGIPIGSEAFNDAYGEQQRQTQDTLARLAMDANLQAGSEQSRQFGLDQAARSNALQEIVAAMGGTYNPQNPMPSGNAAGVNYSGLVAANHQSNVDAHNAKLDRRMKGAEIAGSLVGAKIQNGG